MDFSDLLTRMRSISDGVDQYISNGSYLTITSSVDALTDQIVVNECYKIIVDELKLLGVVPIVGLEELLADYHQAEGLLAWRMLLDQENLAPVFRQNTSFKDMVVMLVSSPEIDEAVYLVEFEEIYRRFYPGEPLLERIARNLHHLASSYEFRNLIIATAGLSIPRSNMNEENAELRQAFLKEIGTGRVNFEFAIREILKLDPSLDAEYLEHEIRLYDLEKVQSNIIDDMSWAVITKPETLSESLKQKQDALLFYHHSTTPHHIEYYVTTRKHPTKEQIVELVAHHYDPEKGEAQFQADLSDMLNLATTTHNPTQFVVFDGDDINYALLIGRWCRALYPKDGE